MKKIELKTILGEVAFSWESENNTVKETVIELLKAFKGKWIEKINLSDMNLSGIDFSNSKFDNSQFDNSQFDNSKFYNSKFYNSQFYNSKFDNSQFYNSKFDNSQFDNSKFYNSQFYNSQFDNSQFDNSKFYNSQFYNSKFDNSQFDNSKFDNSKFYNSQFDQTSIDNLEGSGALEPVRFDFFGRMLVLKKEVPALRQALVDGKVDGSSYHSQCACFIGTIAKQMKCDIGQLPGIKPDASSDTERWFMGISKGHTPENSNIVALTIKWIDEFLIYSK